jgi:exopolysaccharide biosynthesis WecB/TagA/CpsF family protein
VGQNCAEFRGLMTIETNTRPPALLFGVAIENLTMDETIDAIGDLVASGRRQHRTHQVATVNVDFLVNALADESVRQLLQQADMCLADGMPVVWGAKAAGMALRERVTGADLVPALAQRSVSTGWRIHLFGSAPGTAERAAELLNTRYPGASVTGDSGPFITDIDRVDAEVLAAIIDVDPDILCVALGNPKQERFIHRYRDQLRSPVMIGIGGTLDLLIGDKRRAPRWVQRAGLEWTVRAAQEPGRLVRRYARDARVFAPRLFTYLRQVRRHRYHGSLQIESIERQVIVRAVVRGVADPERWHEAVTNLRHGASLQLNLEDAAPLRLPAFAELTGLVRVARQQGRSIAVSPIDQRLITQVSSLGLSSYLGPDATNV